MIPCYIIFSSLIAICLSLILTIFFRSLFLRANIVGIDQFKINKPKIPTCVGISYGVTSSLAIVILYLLGCINAAIMYSYSLMMMLCIIVGLIDDFYDPPGVFKPIAMLFAGIPLIIFRCYTPYLKTILYGGYSLPILYPFMILLAFSVTSNTVNMLDVINGSAVIGVFMVLLSGLLASIITKSSLGVIISIILLSSLIGILLFNIYPAKIFLGNVGSLSMGASIAFLAVTSRIELPLVVAMFPFIHNSFYFLAKVRGFIEHKKLNVNITFLDDRGFIVDAEDKRAPLTLLRLLVSSSPRKENELLNDMLLLFIISLILSVITSYLITIRV